MHFHPWQLVTDAFSSHFHHFLDGPRAQGSMGPRAQGLKGPRAHGPKGPWAQKHRFSLGKPRFSIRRQRGGNAPGKDNSTPAEDLHNKNPSLPLSGIKTAYSKPPKKTQRPTGSQNPSCPRWQPIHLVQVSPKKSILSKMARMSFCYF